MKVFILMLFTLIFSQSVFAQAADTAVENANPPQQPRAVQVEERVDINEGADKQAQIKKKREKYYPLNTSLATTIITREEIKASGARNLADVLRTEFGPRVIEIGTSAVAGIRGTKAEEIMILVNGMELNTAQGFAVDLKSIPVYNVERVEIIRGGASARFGAGAVGGVINVITVDKVNRFKGVENVIGYGSYDVFSLSTLMGKNIGSNEQGNIFVSGLFNTADGDFNYSVDGYDILGNTHEYEGRIKNNKTLKGNAYASFFYTLNETDVLHFDMSALTDNKEIPNIVDDNFDGNFGNQSQEVQRYSFNFAYENNSLSVFNLTLRAGVLHQVKNYNSGGNAATGDSYNNLTTRGSLIIDRVDEFFGVFVFKNDIELHYKNEYFHTLWERGYWFTGGTPNDAMRHTVSIAYLPELSFPKFEDSDIPRFTIYPAFRFDTSMIVGAKNALPYFTPSYGLGFLYSFDRNRRYNIKANFGTGYRLPSFEDLYPATNELVSAPPTLLREESLYGDVGFIIQPINMLTFEGFYHVQKIRDMITWVQRPDDLTTMAVPLNGAFLHGGEVSALLSLPIPVALSRFEIKANYLYQFSLAVASVEDIELATKLPKIPTHSANGRVSYIFEGNKTIGFRLNAYVHYISSVYDDIFNDNTLPSVFLLDATGAVTLFSTFSIEGGVKNILDTRYENAKGYLQPGREWFVAVRGRF